MLCSQKLKQYYNKFNKGLKKIFKEYVNEGMNKQMNK